MNSCGIFIASYVDRDVEMTFRNYKFMEFYLGAQRVKMDILSLTIEILKEVVTESVLKGESYTSFYTNKLLPLIWFETTIGIDRFENEVLRGGIISTRILHMRKFNLL